MECRQVSLKLSNPKLYKRLCDKIREIRSNPFKSKFKNLKNTDGYRRARLGDYRIVYFVEGNNIIITRIGLRSQVYKRNYTVNHFTINEFINFLKYVKLIMCFLITENRLRKINATYKLI